MMTRIMFIAGGVVFTVFGVLIMMEKGFLYFGEFIKLGETTIPVAIVSFIIAGLNIWLGIRKKTARIYEQEYLICPECKEVYTSDKVPDCRCLKCNAQLEPLSGFYDRHPKLKDLGQEKPHEEM
ncbi:MAG: hypothetical protein PHT49_09470 [Desulfovibrionales bacterium]|nr:hypothetical protein [Desulfovibrionales bacterium]